MICFHEQACTGAEFAFLAEALNSAGFEVICPDWIGHGQSTYFSDKGAYRWHDFVTCALHTVRHYSDQETHLLGASFGGMILFVLMVAARLAPKTATFVDIPLHKGVGPLELPLVKQLVGHSFSRMEDAKKHFAEYRHPLHRDSAHLEEYLTANRFHVENGKVRVRCDPLVVARLEAQSGNAFDYRNDVPSLNCNSLFLYGRESANRDREFFEKLSTQSRHILYDDSIEGRHPPPLTSFSQIKPIVDFLISQPSSHAFAEESLHPRA